MNCCNDYGKCTGGHGCPARPAGAGTHEQPASTIPVTDADIAPVPLTLTEWTALALALLLIVACIGAMAGYLSKAML